MGDALRGQVDLIFSPFFPLCVHVLVPSPQRHGLAVGADTRSSDGVNDKGVNMQYV